MTALLYRHSLLFLKLSVCDLVVLKTELFSVETKTAERETPVFPVYVTEKIVIDVSSVCIENFITFSLKRDGREQFVHNRMLLRSGSSPCLRYQ